MQGFLQVLPRGAIDMLRYTAFVATSQSAEACWSTCRRRRPTCALVFAVLAMHKHGVHGYTSIDVAEPRTMSEKSIPQDLKMEPSTMRSPSFDFT